MRIEQPHITARQAADIFAKEAWEKPRKVGKWKQNGLTPSFQLVHGIQWYSVLLLPHCEGWEIVADIQPA